MTPYNRPHLSFKEQRELLQERGLVITDATAAEAALERVGYYRLQPYWTAFQDQNGAFQKSATLKNACDLYVFDKKLRLITLDAIERIEVAIRVKVAHALGRRDPWGHRDARYLDTARCQRGDHQGWLERTDASTAESHESWVAEHIRSHGAPLPIWKAIETWSFGEVSKLYSILHLNDRYAISKAWGMKPDTLQSWLKCLVVVRNICAHHSRLWNKPLVNQPQLPQQWEARSVQHIGNNVINHTRFYAAAVICAYLLSTINPRSQWKDRLKGHVLDFPEMDILTIGHAGFPDTWETEGVWN